VAEQQPSTGVLEPAQLLPVVIRPGIAVPQLDGVPGLAEDGGEPLAL
jgi:hypothetical protein